MANPTAVNGQITDSVTQANVQVLGDAPATAMGGLFQATDQALSNAAHNATRRTMRQTLSSNLMLRVRRRQPLGLRCSILWTRLRQVRLLK